MPLAVQRALPRVAAVLLAAALALTVATTGAEARVALVSPSGGALPGAYQGWVNASRVPTVDGRVTVRLAPCPGHPRLAGCVNFRRLDELFLTPGLPRQQSTLLHELGHLFDFTTMRAADRRAFARASGRRARNWYAGRNPLFEQFGEGYSFCARFRTVVRRVGPFAIYGYDVGPTQHRRVCTVIRRAAAHGPARRPERPPQSVRNPEPLPPEPPADGPQDPAAPAGPTPGPSSSEGQGEAGAAPSTDLPGTPPAPSIPLPLPIPPIG